MTDRWNSALIVGTERTLRPAGAVRLYNTANLGFFQHHWWMAGVFLDTEFGVGRALPLGFQTDLRFGLGYLHYFWRRECLKLENGRYVQATDWGRPSLRVPLSLMLGYHGDPTHPLAVAPFVSAQWAAQILFQDEIPVMTHLLFLLGVRIEWGRAAPASRR